MIRAPAAGALVAALLASLAPASPRAEDAAVPAREPPPDPAAVEAGDANLESIALRRGFILTFAFGGAISVGVGMDGATGSGGAVTLRLAHVASSRAVFAVELVGNALFFDESGTLYQTNTTSALIAGQYYLNPALWVRAGAGLGRYAGNELRMGDFILRERVRLAGPAGSAGAGVDVVRLKRFRASLEFSSTAMLSRDGVLSSNAFLIGLSID